MKFVYVISALGYDANDCVTDYECDLQVFDDTAMSRNVLPQIFTMTVNHIKETISAFKLTQSDAKVKYIVFQLEKCRATKSALECVEILMEDDVVLGEQ